jgi:acetyltransferase-like isoleucine patch superfamily enzyme
MNETTPPTGRLKQHLHADPLLWTLWLSIRRTFTKIKSACLGLLFGAARLYLGPGCRIHGARFVRFGSNLYAQGHLWMEAINTYNDQHFLPDIEIGHHVSFSERVHITCIEKIRIGNGVLVGSGVYIGDHHHGAYRGSQQSHPDTPPIHRPLAGGGPVIIQDNVWIGDNVVIVGPVTIGRGSIIGANSVVRGDIPDRTIAAGAPARAIKKFNDATGQWERIREDDPDITPVLPAGKHKDARG